MSTKQTDYSREYNKAHTRQIPLTLNKNTDADILAWMEQQDSVFGSVKQALRSYMEENNASQQETDAGHRGLEEDAHSPENPAVS